MLKYKIFIPESNGDTHFLPNLSNNDLCVCSLCMIAGTNGDKGSHSVKRKFKTKKATPGQTQCEAAVFFLITGSGKLQKLFRKGFQALYFHSGRHDILYIFSLSHTSVNVKPFITKDFITLESIFNVIAKTVR